MGAALKSVEMRTTKRLPIRVLVEYESIEDFLIDYTANISIGGMFIQTERPLPVGTRFRLRFQVPTRAKPIETFGEVCWSMEANSFGAQQGMGIRFDDLSGPDERLVREMFDSWEDDVDD
jgi:uncharacterized protein (TIGR02266 family)